MPQPVDLSGMALFVRIVEAGSLSAASRLLGVPKASVSRRLALLEGRLGASLLSRSTRAMTLTDFGRRYFERVRPIVRDAELAQMEAEAQHASPSGLLRISMPRAYGLAVVAPALYEFAAQHPAVRLDLHFSDERVNLVAGGFDLVIRVGDLEDSELIGRRLDETSVALVAAPAYLARHGTPTRPRDLLDHRAIVTRPDLDHWTIGGTLVRVAWHTCTGDMTATRDAALAGLGIALVPCFMVDEDIEKGDLVELLPGQAPTSAHVNLLYARSSTPSPALSALIEHLGRMRGLWRRTQA